MYKYYVYIYNICISTVISYNLCPGVRVRTAFQIRANVVHFMGCYLRKLILGWKELPITKHAITIPIHNYVFKNDKMERNVFFTYNAMVLIINL